MTACSRGWHRSPQLSTALHGICDRHAVVPCVPSDKALALLQVAYIPDRHWLTPSWMHDFACTDKYAVLLEQPLYMVRFVEDPWVIDSVWDTPVSPEAVLLQFTSPLHAPQNLHVTRNASRASPTPTRTSVCVWPFERGAWHARGNMLLQLRC